MSECLISIVCPTLNEENYVEDLIQVFLSDCPQPSELFFADAGSTDNTIQIIKKWSSDNSNIKLVYNGQKFVSHAFNKCFKLASGKYLALLGAHTFYPDHFFKIAYQILETDECDVVGGPLKQIGHSSLGKAIAYGMSTRFGVGGTEFRTSKERSFVDSVAFAFYKRKIFNKIGLFDESLIRNQDDEMHYRINSAGYKILMEPKMECAYYVRENLGSLIQQYYNYGLFKPLVLRKVKSGIRIRHLVPAVFVLYLLFLPLLFLMIGIYSIIPILLYIGITMFFSIFNSLSLISKVKSLLIYPVLHISYGTGFLFGLQKL